MKKITYLYQEMRVWQWIKNLLIFLPLIFSLKLLEIPNLLITVQTFFSFCFASSFVYIVNDIFDINDDKQHPQKKLRPLASGNMSIKEGLFFSFLFLSISLYLSIQLNTSVFGIILLYIFLNFFYSKFIKHVVILDIILVSLFYLLRVYLGGLVLDITISGWLLLTTFFASLFMIIGKRRAELMSSNTKIYTRRVLNEYNEKFLDAGLLMSLNLFIFSYSLYSLNHNRIFSLSIIIVIYAILRYLYLIYVKKLGEEPDKLVFRDVEILFSGLLWLIVVIISLYYKPY